MQNFKMFAVQYGVYVLIAVVFLGAGFFWGRFNIVILTESQWDVMTRANAQIQVINEENEREQLLTEME